MMNKAFLMQVAAATLAGLAVHYFTKSQVEAGE
jgi:hypothetical protein